MGYGQSKVPDDGDDFPKPYFDSHTSTVGPSKIHKLIENDKDFECHYFPHDVANIMHTPTDLTRTGTDNIFDMMKIDKDSEAAIIYLHDSLSTVRPGDLRSPVRVKFCIS